MCAHTAELFSIYPTQRDDQTWSCVWCLPGHLSPCLQHTEYPSEELPWELKHCIPALFPSVSTPSMAYSLEKKNHRLFETLLGRGALSSVVGVIISQFPAQVARPQSTDPTEVRFLRLLLSPPRIHFPAPGLLLHILSQLLPPRCVISKESYLFPCLDTKLPVLHTLPSLSALLCHTSLPSPLFRSSLPQIPSRTSLTT